MQTQDSINGKSGRLAEKQSFSDRVICVFSLRRLPPLPRREETSLDKFVFHEPDAAAMERLLAKELGSLTGAVLCLAWRAGLSREEIRELRWDQTDLSAHVLRLPDRETPIPPKAAAELEAWRDVCGESARYVAVSEKYRSRVAPESISRMVRRALDSEGQTEVRLQDLRHDCIRRLLLDHDWPWVLRVTGLTVGTYRGKLIALSEGAAPPPKRLSPPELGQKRLETLLRAESHSPAGLALWLSSEAGLRCSEIVRLTWAQVDFTCALLRTDSRTVVMSNMLGWVLADELGRRGVDEDPHVVLSPRSRRPVEAARLNSMVRSLLIRWGIEDRTMAFFRRDTEGDRERTALRDYVRAHGSISRGEAAALLGITEGMAYRRLLALTDDGSLVRVNLKYYLAGDTIPPERQEEAIVAYLRVHGPARREELAELLHIGKRHAGRILKGMAERGTILLLPSERSYAAPEDGAEVLRNNYRVISV